MATLRLGIDASGARRGAQEFGRSADEIKRKAREIHGSLGGAKVGFEGLKKSIFEVARAVPGPGPGLGHVVRGFAADMGELDASFAAIGGFGEAAVGLGPGSRGPEGTGLEQRTRRVDELEQSLDNLAQQQAATARVFEESRAPLAELDTGLGELNERVASGTVTWDRYGRAVGKAQLQLGQAADKSRDLTRAAADASRAVSSAFGEAVIEGENLVEVLEGLEGTLLRILTRFTVTRPLERAIAGLFGGGGLDLGALLDAGGEIAGGAGSELLSNVGADVLHGGGIVGAANVAQRVLPAEVFAGAPRFQLGLAPDEFPAVLHRGEAVIPANIVRAIRGGQDGGGQQAIVINGPLISVNTPDAGSFRTSEAQLGTQVVRALDRVRGRMT